MTRFAAAALFALAATSAAAQTAQVLRPTVLVAGDLVRIGDLVEHAAPGKAQIAVFRSPDLGDTGTISVAKVIEALRPHDVLGVDAEGLSEISVTRASRIVGSGEIKARIADIVAERLRVSDPTNIAVAFDGPIQAIHLDTGQTAPLMPVRMSFDPRGGKFDMTFRSGGAAQVRITGVAHEAHDALVLTRPLARGDIVRASDVAVERRSKTENQGDIIREPAAAVGLALQQPLRAGQPLRAADLVKPQLVKRSESVILHYEVPGIALTARGKAEEAGALGDIVNVLNVQSKRVVQGVVTGPGQVTMTSLTPRIAATANLAPAPSAATVSAALQKSE